MDEAGANECWQAAVEVDYCGGCQPWIEAFGVAQPEDLAGEAGALSGRAAAGEDCWGAFLARVAVGVADGIVEALESGVSRGKRDRECEVDLGKPKEVIE